MYSVHLWEKESALIDYLANQLLHNRLALVLGSGISKPFGLPDWGGLAKNIWEEVKDTPDNTMKVEAQMEYIKINYFKNKTEEFIRVVSKALYKEFKLDFEKIRSNRTLSAIGSLVMASSRGSVAEIITLNFDNLLELYLSFFGFCVIPISEERHWHTPTDVRIYHPHGYLPVPGTGGNSNDIVFDQDSYLKIIGNPNVLWYQLVATVLRRHTCIFIGLSGDDNNLDALLKETQNAHASVDDHLPYWGVRFTTNKNDHRNVLWEEKMVKSRYINNWDFDLPDFLFKICRSAALKKIKEQ